MSHSLHIQGLRYIIIGLLNTLIGYGVFYLGLRMGLYHQLALVLCYLVGGINSYFWNRLWTFRATGSHAAQGTKFVVMTILILILNAIMLEWLVRIGFKPALAQIGCLFVTTIVGFFGHRFWSFRSKPHPLQETCP